MPEPAHTPPKPTSIRGAASDDRVLAQIEKWMAMIREIAHDQQVRPPLRA